MSKYRLMVDGEIDDDETFDSEEDADYAAMEWKNNWNTGAETPEMSNPGDYPYDSDDCPSVEVVEIDED